MNANKLVRKGGRQCQNCGFSSPDPTVILLACGQCKNVYYCNKDCQKAHWKTHKRCCMTSHDQKAIVSANLGADFSDYADKWRKQHMVAIATIASLVVTPLLIETHALMLFCDYDTNANRSRYCLIQVNGAEAVSLDFLDLKYGSGIRTGFVDIAKTTYDDGKTNFFRVLSIIYNKDKPEQTTPLCKVSYLGFPKGEVTRLTLDDCIRQINKGDYRIL